MLPRLLDHAIWADAEAARALAALPEGSAERAEGVRLYAHLAAAAHVWLARLHGRTPTHAVWPDLSLDAARALAAESLAGLRAIAGRDADELAAEVEYRTTTGAAFRNTVADVLAHVALHGSHHRGQLALLTRRGGGTPATTDYVVYLRAAPTPTPGASAPTR